VLRPQDQADQRSFQSDDLQGQGQALHLDCDAMLPQSPASGLPATWSDVRWVLTDVDDTLTLQGRLPPESLNALSRLREAGLKVIAVTGACAGWCDHIAQAWPLDAVIGENGAFVMHRHEGRLRISTAQPMAEMRRRQAILLGQIEGLLKDHPDLGLTLDQPYRLCEVAIDIGQHRERVEAHRVEALVRAIRAMGAQASASSIHINAWQGTHSKRSAALEWLARHGIDAQTAQREVCCIGDSPNDQGLFEVLPLSVGVANIRRHWQHLQHRPSVVMTREGGLGFAEFAELLLARVRPGLAQGPNGSVGLRSRSRPRR
jgi:HAD superfamily hydrolase (TIGR01484 family)